MRIMLSTGAGRAGTRTAGSAERSHVEKHDVKVTPAPVSRARARSPEVQVGRTPDRRAPAALVLNEIEFSRHRIPSLVIMH
jgi:hypothetical protein